MRLHIRWIVLLLGLVGCGNPQHGQEATLGLPRTPSIAEAPPSKESRTPIPSPTVRVVRDPLPTPHVALTTLPPQPSGDFVVDFTACEPTTGSVFFDFGHLVYTITGIDAEHCLMEYGSEVENPRWDGALDTHCRIPVVLGVQVFPIRAMGVDVSAIDGYCTKR